MVILVHDLLRCLFRLKIRAEVVSKDWYLVDSFIRVHVSTVALPFLFKSAKRTF